VQIATGVIDRETIFAQGRGQFLAIADRLYLSLQWQARREAFKPLCSQQRCISLFQGALELGDDGRYSELENFTNCCSEGMEGGQHLSAASDH
jgi:hypothetical protein